MTFEEVVRYIGTPAALGVVSSLVLALIRRVWPNINEGSAVIASLLVAMVAYIGAAWALPLLPQLPPQVELYWPAVVYLFQQLWYWLMKDAPVMSKVYRRGA